MKILIASDLHGDIEYTKALVELFHGEKFDRLYLLGDLLYDSIHILNPISDKITAVTGNCDSPSEIEEARFLMPTVNYDYQFKKVIVMSHGNRVSPYNYEQPFDIFFFGHTHCSYLNMDSFGRIIANPGSFACPRDGIHSFMIMDDEGIKLIDYNSKAVITKLKF